MQRSRSSRIATNALASASAVETASPIFTAGLRSWGVIRRRFDPTRSRVSLLCVSYAHHPSRRLSATPSACESIPDELDCRSAGLECQSNQGQMYEVIPYLFIFIFNHLQNITLTTTNISH